MGARSQKNFFNWLFPCIQHILSTLSRGAELEMANSSQACNALTGQTYAYFSTNPSTLSCTAFQFRLIYKHDCSRTPLDLENTE